MKIKTDGLILDVDGTIWNTTNVITPAWNAAIEAFGRGAQKITAELLQKEFGKPMNVIADDFWPSLSDEEKGILMKECSRFELAALNENQDDISYPAVRETLEALSKKFKVYIVSNCQSGYIELTMQKNKIEHFISDSECYGNTKMGKAQNLRLLIERNALKAPVYVGDTQGDADACAEAGVKFIWAAYGFGSAKNYAAKISSFSELLDLLQN